MKDARAKTLERARLLILGCLVFFLALRQAPAPAVEQENFPYPLRNKESFPYPLLTKPQKPIQVDKKSYKLENMIDSPGLLFSFPQPVPLQGIKIAGLGSKGVQTLGESYFVVVGNTGATKMSEIYRSNRLAGKANFVTVDCILHPYLAFTNRVYAEVIQRQLMPLLRSLLQAMLQVAVGDYHQADDHDVRSDIEANIAFLSIGLKIINPHSKVPELGRVPELVRKDFEALSSGKKAKSAIFEREEDFSCYQPTGWYASDPALVAFFRAKMWLCKSGHPLNDVDFDAGQSRANSFRRSVLLYRCLDLAEVNKKPAFEVWVKLVKGLFLLGAQVESWNDKSLYPHDYRAVFKTNSADLKVTLTQLAEPLYRTKLLLAVRRQKPQSLAATSIWDIEDSASAGQSRAWFRLVPETGLPEGPWLRSAGAVYPSPSTTTLLFPAALIDLNNWGASQAGNVLLNSTWALEEEKVARAISDLKKWTLRRLAGGQAQAVESRIWSLVSPLLRIMPDGIQSVLRSEMWTNRRMESAFAAVLDSMCAIGPPFPPETVAPGSSARAAAKTSGTLDTARKVAAPGTAALERSAGAESRSLLAKTSLAPATSSGQTFAGPAKGHPAGAVRTSEAAQAKSAAPASAAVPSEAAFNEEPAPQARRSKRAARGHYVDPCPEVFAKLTADASRIETELNALGFSCDTYKNGFAEFTRLFQRLQKIAEIECSGQSLSASDLSLLSNIDLILEKIDVALPAVLSFQAHDPASSPKETTAGGFNMALGRPGQLYIILQNKAAAEWTLARGAVYTYFEIPGSQVTVADLLRRIDAAKIQPPYWVDRFDLLQPAPKASIPANSPATANRATTP